MPNVPVQPRPAIRLALGLGLALSAAVAGGHGLVPTGEPAIASHWDLRLDPSPAARDLRDRFRAEAAATSASAAHRAQVRADEARLRARLPDLVLDAGEGLGTPELVGRGPLATGFLTAPAPGADRVARLRAFMADYPALYGIRAGDVGDLAVVADYVNPDGQLAWVHLEQRLNGFPVFRGEVKAGFAPDGAIIRTIGNLAPAIDAASLATETGDLQQAVRVAATSIGVDLGPAPLVVRAVEDAGRVARLDPGPLAGEILAEAMYFPIEPGVARLAWRVLLWQPDLAWYVIVDAGTGEPLWRWSLTAHQTQSATYGIYTDESPAPLRPAPLSPNTVQGPLIGRSNVSLIGNESPNTFNNNGWITDGGNTTAGNNVDAGLDRVAPNGIDPDGRAVGAGFRTFSHTYNPSPGNPAPGEEPVSPGYPPTRSASQNGAITNAFYWANRFHDQTYQRGFTEPARNFQLDNFGRGGTGNDPVHAEIQDSAGSNNANFSAPADGGIGRLQLFVWTGSTPDRDGALDQTVALHELAHGLTRRLVGNGSGLTGAQAQGLGEGWSDFYAISILAAYANSPANDYPVNGLYKIGAYSAYLFGGSVNNNYYGIKRFPYALKTVIGGPDAKSHNPLTFADIDAGQIDVSDGAYPIRPGSPIGATQLHNMGEVWAMALFEVRARLINRLGYGAGNTRMLQLVTDGAKLTPLAPNFIQARDAVLAAAASLGGTDTADAWSGFARRGMGFGASTDGTTVVESFLVPDSIFHNGLQFNN
jgi:hypothetical protein